MEQMKEKTKTKPVQVWQVCQCKVTDKRDYCVSCFPSKSAHLAEAMRDEDTFLRHSDMRLEAIKSPSQSYPVGTKT